MGRRKGCFPSPMGTTREHVFSSNTLSAPYRGDSGGKALANASGDRFGSIGSNPVGTDDGAGAAGAAWAGAGATGAAGAGAAAGGAVSLAISAFSCASI